MDETKAPGEFPEIELGGKKYTVKFTRGMLYRLDKMGIQFSPRFTPQGSTCTLSNIIDVLHVVIGFEGSHEELAELAYDQRNDIHAKLVEAWGKVVLPSLQAQASAQAAAKALAESTTLKQ
jgi:hypothetical protein